MKKKTLILATSIGILLVIGSVVATLVLTPILTAGASGNALRAKKHSPRPLLHDSEIRAARNGQSCAKYAPSAFTDEVNCIVDNEKQKAVLVVGVRSARACVTMPSAANQ